MKNSGGVLMGHQERILQTPDYVVWPRWRPLFPPNKPFFQSSPSSSLSHRATRNRVWTHRTHRTYSGFCYNPLRLNESKPQTHFKTHRYRSKKKKFGAPLAPRNTTSFLIRAKKHGGFASSVSPCPVTPLALPSPTLSPVCEMLVDTAKQEWGVNGYGSMKGLIRLKAMKEYEGYEHDLETEDDSSVSDNGVRKCVEIERRLACYLSRFEMIYPDFGGGEEQSNVLENRVDEQDLHIAKLEEDNFTVKERLFLMERELEDMKRRVQLLESEGGQSGCWDGEASGNALEGDGESSADAFSEKSVHGEGKRE